MDIVKLIDQEFDINGRKTFFEGRVLHATSGYKPVTGIELINAIARARWQMAQLDAAVADMTAMLDGK